MNRRNILLYTLAGVFSVIGALINGISPFLAGSPAAEKIVSLCLAIILILIGVSAITASSRIKKSGNADLRLTEKIMPALLCVMAIFILVDAAVYIALGQETAQNIGLSELYIKVMSALFVAVIAVFAFIPSSKYKRRDGAEK